MHQQHPYRGLIIAFALIGLWVGGLGLLLTGDLGRWSPFLVPIAVVLQTFLYTGLFITAHDGMHGSLCPLNHRLNHFGGMIAVRLYALFSYSRLRQKHSEHHQSPASSADPDFHDASNPSLVRWYLRFMGTYLHWQQVLGMALVFNLLHHLVGVSVTKLLLFWVTPAFLSTLQLFYFGTYLPHRETEEGYFDAHRARSNEFPLFWSFVTCYHFGYHWEHHEYPHVPWWQLPKWYRRRAYRRPC